MRGPSHPFCFVVASLTRLVEAANVARLLTFPPFSTDTGNTVCGRHPIGVMMAAIEEIRTGSDEDSTKTGEFKFVRYERSSEVARMSESSVSYASAFAVV